MKYARVINGIVVETFEPPVGFTIHDCFTPQVVEQFELCPVEVEQNWLKQEDGSFIAPPPAPEPEPAPAPEP